MADAQPGILAPVPRLGRYLNFSLKAGAEPRQALLKLIDLADGNQAVVGLGPPAVLALGKTIKGLKQIVRRLRSAIKKNGRRRRRHHRRAVQVYPAGFRKLFLVSADDSR